MANIDFSDQDQTGDNQAGNPPINQNDDLPPILPPDDWDISIKTKSNNNIGVKDNQSVSFEKESSANPTPTSVNNQPTYQVPINKVPSSQPSSLETTPPSGTSIPSPINQAQSQPNHPQPSLEVSIQPSSQSQSEPSIQPPPLQPQPPRPPTIFKTDEVYTQARQEPLPPDLKKSILPVPVQPEEVVAQPEQQPVPPVVNLPQEEAREDIQPTVQSVPAEIPIDKQIVTQEKPAKKFNRSGLRVFFTLFSILLIICGGGYLALRQKWVTLNGYEKYIGISDSQPQQKIYEPDLTIPQKAQEYRDSIRKKDLAGLANTLKSYQQENSQYPMAADWVRTNDYNEVILRNLKPKYLPIPIVDPMDPTYYYGYRSLDGKSFELTCVLENKADPEGTLVGKYFLYRIRN